MGIVSETAVQVPYHCPPWKFIFMLGTAGGQKNQPLGADRKEALVLNSVFKALAAR